MFGLALLVLAACAVVGIVSWLIDRPRYPGGPPHSLGFWMTENEHRRWQAGWRPMSLREAERWHARREV